MSVLPQFTNFRDRFALHAAYATTGSDPLQLTAPDTLSRAGISGDWVADGFLAGQRIQVVGSTSNDRYFTIDTVSVEDLVTVEQDVVTEGPLTSGETVTGVFIDPGGFERWPVGNVDQAGFNSGITGWGVPFGGTFSRVSVNSEAADAVKGADEYDWYLSQRTDDPTKQYLTIAQRPDFGASSFSGTVDIVQTALAEAEFGIVGGTTLTPIQIVKLFNKMDLYVQRKSDQLIQWVNLLAVQTANL